MSVENGLYVVDVVSNRWTALLIDDEEYVYTIPELECGALPVEGSSKPPPSSSQPKVEKRVRFKLPPLTPRHEKSKCNKGKPTTAETAGHTEGSVSLEGGEKSEPCAETASPAHEPDVTPAETPASDKHFDEDHDVGVHLRYLDAPVVNGLTAVLNNTELPDSLG